MRNGTQRMSKRVSKCGIFSLVVAGAALSVSSSHADGGLKKNYVLSNFVEETGNDLGYGHYEDDSTASSGKQCKATFRVAEGKSFSITSTTAKGPNGKPVAVVVKDNSGAGSASVPVAERWHRLDFRDTRGRRHEEPRRHVDRLPAESESGEPREGRRCTRMRWARQRRANRLRSARHQHRGRQLDRLFRTKRSTLEIHVRHAQLRDRRER